MEIIKPKGLHRGDTFGIVSPSQSVLYDPKYIKGFNEGVRKLENLGFKVKVGSHARGQYFYSAGTPEERVEDIHQLFIDEKIRVILMSIGGATANEVLPLLDFQLIKRNPKIILGMSDGTTLLSPITDRTGLITFYGPDLIYGFGLATNAKLFDKQIFDCLMEGKVKFAPLRNLKTDDGKKIPEEWKTVYPGKISGRLVGGYLEIINNLVATKYLNGLDGAILYLESMEGSDIIHMRLQYMKLLGVFDRVAGLILGYFPDVEKEKHSYRPIGDIILELTQGKKLPTLQVNELGHMVMNYAWPNGLRVELDATGQKITALENCVYV